jgi:hypothetical protein
MKCNTKTMFFTGAGLLAVFAIAYVTLPQFRGLVLSLGPSLLFLLCPLSMLFMMKSMNSQSDRTDAADTCAKKSLSNNGKMTTKV